MVRRCTAAIVSNGGGGGGVYALLVYYKKVQLNKPEWVDILKFDSPILKTYHTNVFSMSIKAEKLKSINIYVITI